MTSIVDICPSRPYGTFILAHTSTWSHGLQVSEYCMIGACAQYSHTWVIPLEKIYIGLPSCGVWMLNIQNSDEIPIRCACCSSMFKLSTPPTFVFCTPGSIRAVCKMKLRKAPLAAFATGSTTLSSGDGQRRSRVSDGVFEEVARMMVAPNMPLFDMSSQKDNRFL